MAYILKENEWDNLWLPCHRHKSKCQFSQYKEYDNGLICQQCPCAYFDKTRFEVFKEWIFKKSISNKKAELRKICDNNIDSIIDINCNCYVKVNEGENEKNNSRRRRV